MELIAKLDDIGKPAWITLLILSFVLFWPAGLALLAWLWWSGRMGWIGKMGCSKHGRFGHWHNMEGRDGGRRQLRRGDWGFRSQRTSGNRAFDEYREETLRRLEDEQKEFVDFLDRLREARDKAEFDQFLSERRNRPAGTGTDEAPQPA